MLKIGRKNAAFAAFFVCLCLLFSDEVRAEDGVFFGDEQIVIRWPKDVEFVECSASLKAKAGKYCRQLGEHGEVGAVFLTDHLGYALGRRDRLERHLAQSEGALSDIHGVRVIQSRVVRETPLMGLMEIERSDGTLREISAFEHSSVRQTSLLIPTGDRLVQIFIYLPEDSEDGMRLYEPIVMGLEAGITVNVHGNESEVTSSDQTQSGVVTLLPRALFWGILVTAVVVLIISISSRMRRRRREREARLQDAQIDGRVEMTFGGDDKK